MPHPRSFGISVLLLSCLLATAKDKKKGLLPTDVLRARSVLVLVDPNSGMDVRNPNANRTAQEDVDVVRHSGLFGSRRPFTRGHHLRRGGPESEVLVFGQPDGHRATVACPILMC